MIFKRCSKCKESKDSNHFLVKLTSVDGLQSHCRECINHKKRLAYAASAEREVSVVEKKCTGCLEIKSWESFPRHKVSRDGLASRCRACHNRTVRERQLAKASTVHVESKKCPKCDLVKPAEQFTKDGGKQDGLCTYCKHCQAMIRRSQYANSSGYVLVDEKICNRCGDLKPASFFGKHKLSPDGLNNQCKQCKTDKRMRRVYGITYEDYERLLHSQGYACAICEKPAEDVTNNAKKLAVDHNHSCCSGNRSCGNCVRALLCTNCNAALGLLGDDAEVAIRAAKYLLNFSTSTGRDFVGYDTPEGVIE